MSRERAPLPGHPERQLAVPKGCVLTDSEIVTLLVQADEKKRRGGSWISVVDDPGQDGYQVRVPKSAAITREESIVVLSRLNEAKEYGFADLTLSYSDATIVKLWVTLKDKGTVAGGRLTIMGPRRTREF